jgi:hypothetical protein
MVRLSANLRGAFKLFVLTALFALCAPLAFSQENAGSIQGKVLDTNGAAVSGAQVTVEGPNLVRPLEDTSHEDGSYFFGKVPVGIYTVTVTQSGFKSSKKEAVQVQLGSEARVDFGLEVGNVSETVTVTGSSDQIIDLTSSKTATNINERFMDNTPKGRGFNTILQTAPGVIYDTRSGSSGGGVSGTSGNSPGGGVGGYSVNGASGSENAFVIDGVEVSNVRNAALGRESAIPFEFVREVQVKSGGYEAEFGGATGGVVNVITKSGSDEFHGRGSLSYTNSLLNSRPRGFFQRNPLVASVAEFYTPKEDDYSSVYPGFSLGGPILKERLHFFTSYFPEFTRTERNIAFLAGPRTTSNKVTRHFGLARVDYAPSQKIQLNSSFLWTPIRNKGLLTGTDPRIAPPTNDLSIGGGYTPASAFTTSFTYTPTSAWVISARYGYKYMNDKGNTYGLPTAVLTLYQRATSGSAYVGPAVPAEFAGAAGKQNVSNTFNVVKDITTRHNIYLDASYLARIGGQQHVIKGGFAQNRIENVVNDDYPNGRFDFYWGEGFSRGSISGARGTYGYYIWEDGVKHDSGANSSNKGFYIQDQWQIHRRVTANFGIRFENEFLPPFTQIVNGVQVANPIAFGWGDKIAPRFGIAVDVLGNGKWKLSGGWGRFVDTLKYELARTSFGGDYWHQRVYRLENPNINLVSKTSPGALGTLIIDIDNRTIPINAQGEIEGIDPAIKPMSSNELTISSEHALGGNTVVSARYTRKRLEYGIEDIGILDADENEVYTIGNPGYGATDATQFVSPQGEPLVPKAVRDYDAFELRLDKRFTEGPARNLNVFASYTYSRLFGNWSGLANSDEAGRSQPNVSRAFDLTPGNFDANGKNVYGLLATDRPHQFKFFGNYLLNTRAGATTFSLSQVAFSGTPLSSEVTFIVPVFYNGRGDLGRTPWYTQTDLLLAHRIPLTERVALKFDANVINLLNQATVVGVTTRLNRNGSVTALHTDEFFAGGWAPRLVPGSPGALLNVATGAAPAYNPIYNLPSAFQGNREIRLGVHLEF